MIFVSHKAPLGKETRFDDPIQAGMSRLPEISAWLSCASPSSFPLDRAFPGDVFPRSMYQGLGNFRLLLSGPSLFFDVH